MILSFANLSASPSYDGTVSYTISYQIPSATTNRRRWTSPSPSELHPRSSMRNITVFIEHCCDTAGGENQLADLVVRHKHLNNLKIVLNSSCFVHHRDDTAAIEKLFLELKKVLSPETKVHIYNFGTKLETAARLALAGESASNA